MKASVKWVSNAMFQGESGSGHSVVIDGPPDKGGLNQGMRPMELVLMGVAACASFDVVTILQKARQPVTDCVAYIEAERADEVPSVFTRIHVEFVVTGENLKESQVKRAVLLSADKYCSASIMMARAGVDMTHAYRIVETNA
ncbi:MAG: OsmC family protein [Pseudomonadales bacterium]